MSIKPCSSEAERTLNTRHNDDVRPLLEDRWLHPIFRLFRVVGDRVFLAILGCIIAMMVVVHEGVIFTTLALNLGFQDRGLG